MTETLLQMIHTAIPHSSQTELLENRQAGLSVMTLSTLPVHRPATIVAVTASNELQGRLMGMGLTVGSIVEVFQSHYRGKKPLLISVGETRIAIGADIAKMILVESENNVAHTN